MIADHNLCPPGLRESIDAYVDGRPTGGFLRAVLENDLEMAVVRADATNLRLLPEIVAYVLYVVPPEARGSSDAVSAHIRAKQELHYEDHEGAHKVMRREDVE